jgi:hypothetical protein
MPVNTSIRGELIIKKKKHDLYNNNKTTDLRSIVVGLINSKKYDI